MLHHVSKAIPPASLDACVAFYGLIGFTPVDVPAGIAGRAVWLQSAGGQQVHLMPTPGAEPTSGHFAVVCPDYETTLAALRSAGHEVGPRREHWGSPRSYVRDPSGNLVELMRSPPPLEP